MQPGPCCLPHQTLVGLPPLGNWKPNVLPGPAVQSERAGCVYVCMLDQQRLLWGAEVPESPRQPRHLLLRYRGEVTADLRALGWRECPGASLPSAADGGGFKPQRSSRRAGGQQLKSGCWWSRMTSEGSRGGGFLAMDRWDLCAGVGASLEGHSGEVRP